MEEVAQGLTLRQRHRPSTVFGKVRLSWHLVSASPVLGLVGYLLGALVGLVCRPRCVRTGAQGGALDTLLGAGAAFGAFALVPFFQERSPDVERMQGVVFIAATVLGAVTGAIVGTNRIRRSKS